ncbi:hypothetical protein [Sinomonas soli]
MTTNTTHQQITVSCATTGDASLVAAALADPRIWGAAYVPVLGSDARPASFVLEPSSGPWQSVVASGTTVTVPITSDFYSGRAVAIAGRAVSLLALSADATLSSSTVTVAGP